MDAGGNRAGIAGRALGDEEMCGRAGSDLRRVRNGQNLHLFRKALQPLTYGVRHGSAYTRVDFVEDQCRCRPAIGKRHDIEQLSGQTKYPVIQFEDGSVYREESKDMAETIMAGKLFDKQGAEQPAS